jgi:hypothetical protein
MTPGSTVLLEKLMVSMLVKKFSLLPFTEPIGTLPCSQEPLLNRILSQFNPQYFLKIQDFSCILPSLPNSYLHPRSPSGYSLQISRIKCSVHFSTLLRVLYFPPMSSLQPHHPKTVFQGIGLTNVDASRYAIFCIRLLTPLS